MQPIHFSKASHVSCVTGGFAWGKTSCHEGESYWGALSDSDSYNGTCVLQAEAAAEMVVDGRTLSRILGTDAEPLLAELANRCSGVVVCRASPSQKAAIVHMMKRFQTSQASTVRPCL